MSLPFRAGWRSDMRGQGKHDSEKRVQEQQRGEYAICPAPLRCKDNESVCRCRCRTVLPMLWLLHAEYAPMCVFVLRAEQGRHGGALRVHVTAKSEDCSYTGNIAGTAATPIPDWTPPMYRPYGEGGAVFASGNTFDAQRSSFTENFAVSRLLLFVHCCRVR